MKLHRTIFAVLLALVGQASAVLLDFGTSFPGAFTGQGNGLYSSAPLNRIVLAPGGEANGDMTWSTEFEIAGLLNTIPGNSFVSTDITKFGATELGGDDGYFLVQPGFNWLVTQYDGKNGGSVVTFLGGNAAQIPYDSADLWGEGNKYAVSHYALAGPFTPPPGGDDPGTPVPDGGSTLMLLGSVMGAIGLMKKKVAAPAGLK